MKHLDLRWNPMHKEWFCAECGRTSPRAADIEARAALDQHDCHPPTRLDKLVTGTWKD